jgi:capsular exopolysaccharide synthesis family protein
MKKRSLARVKQYGWIIILCTCLAAIIGFGVVKIQKPVYQASATMYVIAGAPGNSFTPSLTTNDSIGLATNYASQILSSSTMEYVYQSDPNLANRGYGAADLLADITTLPSATSSTFLVIASASNANDAALLANDVANGFQKYVQAQMQTQLTGLQTSLQNKLTAALKQKSSIEGTLLTVPSNTDPHFAVDNSELTDIYHTIDSLQQQLLALPASATSNLAVIQVATPQSAAPVLKANVVVAATAALGLLLGTLIMLLVIYLDNRLQSVDEVRDKLEMAYLGGIAQSKALQEHPTRPDNSAARELADIGANLRLLGMLPDRKKLSAAPVLLITSAQVSEGKTTAAAALAATLASSGNAVLVIDANLQRPATHLSFDASNSPIGLSGLLKSTGAINVDEVVQRASVPGIWLLSGGAPMNPAGLLLEQRLPALLAHLRRNVDVIIVDGPALLSGSEGCILASMAEGVALVVDSRHDRLPLLLRAKEVLNSLPYVPVGVVMNRFHQSDRNQYYLAASPANSKVEETAPARPTAGGNPNPAREAEPEPSPLKNLSTPQSSPGLFGSAPFSRLNGGGLLTSANRSRNQG